MAVATPCVNKRRSVGFASADIIEFEPTIFTATVTSGGVPVGMSSKERRRIRRRLDSFEQERDLEQEYMEEGFLLPEEREEILGSVGLEENFLTVEEEVNRIIEHRRQSNELDEEYIFGDIESDEEHEADEHYDIDTLPSTNAESYEEPAPDLSAPPENLEYLGADDGIAVSDKVLDERLEKDSTVDESVDKGMEEAVLECEAEEKQKSLKRKFKENDDSEINSSSASHNMNPHPTAVAF